MTEIEPLVLTASVARILKRQVIIYGYDPKLIAERAEVSMDTYRRVTDSYWTTIDLSKADRLLVAAGAHISEAELIWPDGQNAAVRGD